MLGALAGLGAAAIAVMDPFQVLRPARGTENLYSAVEFQIPGLARHYPYDAVVTGTSTSNNFRPAHITAALGWHAMNFAIAASSIQEQRAVLDVALATGRVRHVLWAIDPFAFRPREGRSFPYYLYGEPGWRTAPYFLSLGALQHGLASLLTPDAEKMSLARWTEERNWSTWYAYGPDPVALAWSHRRALGPSPLPDTAAAAVAAIDDSIVGLIRAHPGVRFDLVLLPYNVLYYKMLLLDRPREFEALCGLDTALVARAGTLPSVAIHNFRDDDLIITNMDNFHDLLHFSGELSDRLIDDVAAGRRRTDIAAFAGVCGRIRGIAAAYPAPPG